MNRVFYNNPIYSQMTSREGERKEKNKKTISVQDIKINVKGTKHFPWCGRGVDDGVSLTQIREKIIKK